MHSGYTPNIDMLFRELKQEVVSYMPPEDIYNLSSVSKAWFGFLSELDWRQLITRKFGIPAKTLLRFANYAEYIDFSIAISFSKIYRRLYVLSQQQERLGLYPFYDLPDYHIPLLACCVDNVKAKNLLIHIIPTDDAHAWLKLSIQMYANQTALQLITLFPDIVVKEIAKSTIEAGNLEILIHLLKYYPNLCNSPDELFMPAAYASRHPKILLYLLEYFPERAYEIRGWIAYHVAGCGSLKILCDFLAYYRQKYGDIEVFSEQFNPLLPAAASDDDAMFPYLVEKYPALFVRLKNDVSYLSSNLMSNIKNMVLIRKLNPDFFANGVDLTAVAVSGNIDAARYVIEEFKVDPLKILERLDGYSTIKESIDSGKNLLIHLVETYNLVPGQNLFDMSAEDPVLFQYLLTKFNFTPTGRSLDYAIKSDNMILFDELRQTYRISPSARALDCAVNDGSIEAIHRLMNEFRVQPYYRTIMYINNISMPIARIMLLSILGNDFIPNDKVFNRLLINSHREICRGLETCRAGDFDSAAQHFLQSAYDSIRHFMTFLTRAVVNPMQYHLSERHVVLLRKVGIEATNITVTITEREIIHSMLLNCEDVELKQLAEAFAPPCFSERNRYTPGFG